MLDARLFLGFAIEDVSTTGATIRTLRAGSGPPLLRLARLSPPCHLVEGRELACGHYLAEEQPEEVRQEYLRFFRD